MPYNGSGLFTRNYNWVNDRNAAIPITASRVDADSNDFASGLSSVVTRDGQGPATAVLRINGVGATSYTGGLSTSDAGLILNKTASGNENWIFSCTSGMGRWQIRMGTAAAESGADSGSNFSVDRFHDGGGFVDSPLTINRSTGMVTINNLTVVNALSSPPVTPTNLALAGYLTVAGTSTFTGTVVANTAIDLVTSGGPAAWYNANNSTRSYLFGMSGAGDANFYICYDATAGGTRAYINSAGAAVFTSNLTASGNFNTNGITCTAINTQGNTITAGPINAAAITGTTIVASQNMQVNAGGTNSVFYMQNSWRSWYFINDTSGNMSLVDNSGGAYRMSWYTSGAITCYSNLTCNGNFNTNQINGTNIYGNYIQSNGSLYAAGGSTLVGTISCNAINCTTVNCQGNDITVGNGVNYANHGAHTIGFSNSGTTLTFYALGGSSGSWTFNTSDERTKENIGPAVGDALAELRSLNLISFDYKPFPDDTRRRRNFGFSAQNVRGIVPEAVTEMIHPVDNREELILDTLPLLARCVGAIQQLAARVAALEGART